MITVLKDDLREVNTFLLLMKGTSSRLNAGFQKLIRLMIAIFGKSFWTHVVVGVSFWPYDEFEVKKRNRSINYNSTTTIVRNEAWFMKVWNNEFKEKFDTEHDLDFVFIDTWSQQSFNMNDQDQQEAFEVSFLERQSQDNYYYAIRFIRNGSIRNTCEISGNFNNSLILDLTNFTPLWFCSYMSTKI